MICTALRTIHSTFYPSLSLCSPSRKWLWDNCFKVSHDFATQSGSETEIGNQSTVSNYSCYFQKVFYFYHCCRVQRPILITNSDREKCPPCALWVSCDLVCRRALVNMCPLLLINMTWGQKWPYAFHLLLLRVEFLYVKNNAVQETVLFLSVDLFLCMLVSDANKLFIIYTLCTEHHSIVQHLPVLSYIYVQPCTSRVILLDRSTVRYFKPKTNFLLGQ